MKRYVIAALLALAAAIAPSVALADVAAADVTDDLLAPSFEDIPSPVDDPGALLAYAARAANSGEWRLLVVFALTASAWLARRAGGKAVAAEWLPGPVRTAAAWTQSDRGGTILVFVGALGGSLVTGLGSGHSLSLGLVLSAVGVGYAAIGAYHGHRQILSPKDKAVA